MVVGVTDRRRPRNVSPALFGRRPPDRSADADAAGKSGSSLQRFFFASMWRGGEQVTIMHKIGFILGKGSPHHVVD